MEEESTANGLSWSACPVCLATTVEPFQVVAGRGYGRCRTCLAIFLDPVHWPDRATEKREYDLHDNRPDDPAYCAFLEQLARPLRSKLAPGATGLDYGCGPGPALARLFTEAGYSMRLYDPFFVPDTTALTHTYDFITCTEVAEHFHRPAAEFNTLNRLLRPDGWLGIMTRFPPPDTQFANWSYRRDSTHVVFYAPGTFRWLAAHFAWHCEIPAPNVVLLHKPLPPSPFRF